MAHREEIGSATITPITAQRSVSEKQFLMFMALKQASAGSTCVRIGKIIERPDAR
jgi:hypothetical protein